MSKLLRLDDAEDGSICWAWWRTGAGQDHHRCMLDAGHPGLCKCCCGAGAEAP